MKLFERAFPIGLTALCALYLLVLAVSEPISAHDPDLRAFARLPVSFGGRIKPLDTVARNSLLGIQGKQTFRPGDETLPAIAWLADVMARPEEAEKYAVFRVDHPDVLALLGRKQETSKTMLSAADLRPHQQEVYRQAQRASNVDEHEQTPFDKKVLELAHKLSLYDSLSGLQALHPVPPLGGEPDWLTLQEALQQSAAPASHDAAQAYVSMLQAYHDGDAAAFTRDVDLYAARLGQETPTAVRKAGLETRFNGFAPFYRSTLLYLIVFLLCVGSWILKVFRKLEHDPLARAALALAVLSLAVHSAGLVVRIYLSDRPPVTNLYSSAVFVGWGAVVVSIVLEGIFRNGVGTVTAALVGALTLLVAQGLAADGNDTMAVLQAVLDTNFWLATHVVVVTLGYASTFLAGFLGLVFVIRGLLTTTLDRSAARSLSQMIYGIVCFATLFSFVGTILGGIWADQSWGRFWGWDPKENGALLIVLWNALILHARWGGMVKQRGIAVLAVLGNVVTAWSWFGTNMMGVGLHSYGFMEQALFWLLGFVSSQVLIAGVAAAIPLERWRSQFSARPKPAAAAASPAPAAAEDEPGAPAVDP